MRWYNQYGKVIFLILFIIATGYMAYEIATIEKEAKECIQNPLVYGAKKIELKLGSELSCSCFSSDYTQGGISFNGRGIINGK